MTILKPDCPNLRGQGPRYAIAWSRQIALIVLGTVMMGFTPALALDGSNTNAPKKIPVKNFTSSQQALLAGLDDLKAGNVESSVAALTYAAEGGQPLARWKLGEMYANGEGVPRDDVKAYHYFNRLVEDYDEDQPYQRDLGAISNAFVAVGVYCLNGVPDSDLRSDPVRAHELFQYAATTFGDPNAQYNLAHMYITGAGGLAKDNITAIRWLALAAKKGHPQSQALLGHMLFVGDGLLDQRVRGLMWLELAKDGALGPKDKWIRELYQRDFQMATDDERHAAGAMHQGLAKGTEPIPTRSGATSFLQPSVIQLTGLPLPSVR
jgi:exopolysaccharide production negative regulator